MSEEVYDGVIWIRLKKLIRLDNESSDYSREKTSLFRSTCMSSNTRVDTYTSCSQKSIASALPLSIRRIESYRSPVLVSEESPTDRHLASEEHSRMGLLNLEFCSLASYYSSGELFRFAIVLKCDSSPAPSRQDLGFLLGEVD